MESKILLMQLALVEQSTRINELRAALRFALEVMENYSRLDGRDPGPCHAIKRNWHRPRRPCSGAGQNEFGRWRMTTMFWRLVATDRERIIKDQAARIEALAVEVARLTPYVDAFRREERRADKLGQELDDLRALLDKIEQRRTKAAWVRWV